VKKENTCESQAPGQRNERQLIISAILTFPAYKLSPKDGKLLIVVTAACCVGPQHNWLRFTIMDGLIVLDPKLSWHGYEQLKFKAMRVSKATDPSEVANEQRNKRLWQGFRVTHGIYVVDSAQSPAYNAVENVF
jgi:hypothetical protein